MITTTALINASLVPSRSAAFTNEKRIKHSKRARESLGLGWINAILLLRIQIQLKYTIVSKITSHAKDEGEKRSQEVTMTGINSVVTGKFRDPPVIMTGITSRFISRPALECV
jgi:hypothetical protein